MEILANYKRLVTSILLAFYICTMAVVSIYSYFIPSYNWDMLGYIGVVNSYHDHDPITIHAHTYDSVKSAIPPNNFAQLTEDSEYAKSMYKDANEFVQTLPFYKIRPLYTGFIYLLSYLGVNIVSATVLVSVLSYILIAIILLAWLKKLNYPMILLILAIFLLISKPLWYIAGLSTPDALSTVTLLAGFYFFMERKSMNLFFIFLLLSINARTDNIILILLILFLLWFDNTQPQINKKSMLIVFSLSIFNYFIINKLAHNYGWWTVFSNTFLHLLHKPVTFTDHFNIHDYLFGMLIGMIKSFHSSAAIFMFIAVIGLYLNHIKQQKLWNLESRILIVLLLSIFIHYLLFPVMWDRFFAFQYVMIALITMRTVYEFYLPHNNERTGVAAKS